MKMAVPCILFLLAYLGKMCLQEIHEHFLDAVGLQITHT